MVKGKDNSLLVEFEFVVDLDLALFKFIRDNYYASDMVYREFLSLTDEREIIYNLLNRSHINLLEYLMPEYNTNSMYYEIMDNEDNYKQLLKYATAYDTFGLMVTFLKEASSVSIDILCKNKIEEEFIHNLNSKIHTIVQPTRAAVPLAQYTAIYTKYFYYMMNYIGVTGKHIYVPAARYNMEPGHNCVNVRLTKLFSGTNEIHLIDLYRNVKYRFKEEPK